MLYKILISILLIIASHQNSFALDHALSAAKYAQSRDFSRAILQANKAKDAKSIKDLVLLIKILTKSDVDLPVAAKFASRYPIISRALSTQFNGLLTSNTYTSSDIDAFVKSLNKPTSLGLAALLNAKLKENKTELSSPELKQLQDIWSKNRLIDPLESYITKSYARYFNETSIESKITLLLVNQEKHYAARLTLLLPQKKQIFYNKAISALDSVQEAQQLYNSQVHALDNKQLAHYLYARLLLKHKQEDELLKTLSHANYQDFQAQWWKIKNIAIRHAIRDKKYEQALKLARSNQVKAGADLHESEWLAGFILHRILHRPAEAIPHFHNMFKTAVSSHSIAQSAYWLGRAYAQTKNTQKSHYWLTFACEKYPHYFYGQLASLELSKKLQYNLVKRNEATSKQPYNIKDVLKASSWANTLYSIGMKTEGRQILSYISELDLEMKNIDSIVAQINNKSLLVFFAKKLSNRGYPLIRSSYPNHINLKVRKCKNPKSLYLAIIRQESGFDQNALSQAGARGLMQLMPDTFSRYARALKLKPLQNSKDPIQNLIIGTFYLDQLISMWNGSYIMAIASYNAGENAAARWIREYGDLRQFNTLHQVIDWVELIPYSETRLYVKKVVENVINYEAMVLNNTKTNQNFIKYFGVKKVS